MDVTELGLFRDAATTQTVTAMNQGVPVILGGRLPDDDVGGRRGKPDVLVRAAERSDGRLAYVPVDIKRHKTLASAKDSSPPALTSPRTHRFVSMRRRSSNSPPESTSGTPSSSRITGACWRRVRERLTVAPSAESSALTNLATGSWWCGTTSPNRCSEHSRGQPIAAMSCARRCNATTTSSHFGHRSPPSRASALGADRSTPLVEPIYIKECDDCPWFDYCIDQLGESDASQVLDVCHNANGSRFATLG